MMWVGTAIAMPHADVREYWIRSRTLLAAVVLFLTFVPLTKADSIFYTREKSFQIPFHLDPGETRVRDVILHVSMDDGKTYDQVAAAKPADANFRYHSRGDGWYAFVVQTEDNEGRYYPTNPRLVKPGLRVCVDTRPPEIELRSVAPREGTVAVDWKIRDPNLDLVTLILDYRAQNAKEWLPLNVRQLAEGQFSWTPSGTGQFEVRLRVNDKAGNLGTATTVVTPVAGGGGGTPTPPGGNTRVIHVKSKTFNLTYKLGNVGPSKCDKVEVWTTQDSTRSWMRYDTSENTGSAKITVTREGRFGFTIIPISGVGLAERRPRALDQPQIWVEIDEKPPEVKLIDVHVGTGPDIGKLTIRWTAKDAFLQAQPIELSYRVKPDDEWKPLVPQRLENTTGVYEGKSDGLPYMFFVRVQAYDEAGNVGSDQTTTEVKVDLKIPKVESVDVIGVEVVPTMPPGK